MAAAVKALNSSWYSIKAKSAGTAEIWLYDEIGRWGISARRFAGELKALGDIKHIDLRIHSPGGDVFEGMAIFNLLKSHPAKITVHIDGLAASMGSVIAMAGDIINMPENSMMMIHKPWGIQGGDADDMRKYAELLDKVEDSLITAYRRTGLSDDEIKALLKQETWYTGAEAVAAGFADNLTKAVEVAALFKSQPEYENMPKSAAAFFEPKNQTTAPVGGVQQPAAQPAPAPQGASPEPQPAPQAVPVADDESAIMARLQAAENQRRQGIKAAFAGFDDSQSTLLSECMLDMNCSVEQAKTKLLAALSADTTPTAGSHIHAGNGNIIGDSVRNAIEARAMLGTLEPGNQFSGMSLAELARASLIHRGVGIAGMDRLGIVGLAFTHSSSDFGNLLADVAHKSMLKGYQEAAETFTQWTAKGTLTDFRPSKRVDLSTFPSLDKVAEGAEYKYGKVGDRGEQIMLATYGKLFSITRQAIINDDLSALTRIPQLMGRAAIRTVGDLVYAVLTSNPKMSDGKTLFHADHNNLLAAADFSIANIGAGMLKMRTQKDGEATLDIRPKYLLSPVAMEPTAKALLAAEFDPALVDAKVPNPVRGMLEVISDPRLDDSSANTCYMLADQNAYDTIEVAYLDGNDKPYLEQQQGFTVDGAAFKVRIDAGVAPLSWRTMVKMPGK